jgi:Flp pilus assembly protein TadB
MSIAWMLAAVTGALVVIGVAGITWYALPARVDLADALDRISATPRSQQYIEAPTTGVEQAGVWVLRHLPAPLWRLTPTRDLEILQRSVSAFYGQKALPALIGLATTPLTAWLLGLLGASLPFPVPVGASLAVATGLWFYPDLDVRHKAAEARREFARALGAYLELVAMERQTGSGARQALEEAATIGDSWVFSRISQELARSGWDGQTPWDALHRLSDQLGLPELGDLADIMRLGGEQGAQVVSILRTRANALRDQQRTDAVNHANSTAERLTLPGLVMGAVFTLILILPSLAALYSN